MVRNARQLPRGDCAYVFPFLSPGTYDVAAEGVQFAKVEIKNQELPVNTPKTLDFTMANSVKVEVNLVDATVGNPMSRNLIESLPAWDRNPAALAGLQPGRCDGPLPSLSLWSLCSIVR